MRMRRGTACGVMLAIGALGGVGGPAGLSGLVAGGVVIGGVAVERASAQAQRFDPRRDALERLAKRVTVDFEDARLEDAIEFLRTVSGADIDPKWYDDRRGVGLDRDATVSVTVRELPVLVVLERVLDKAETDDFEQNTWQLTPAGTVEVGPKSVLNRNQELKIYDIQSLLFTIPNYSNVPELDLDSVLNQGQGGGGGGGQGSIFEEDEDDDEDPREREEEQARRIIDLIVEFVEPEQWVDNGGDGGTIRYYRGTLLIRAPDYIHRQVGGYDFWPRSVPRIAEDRAQRAARSEAREARREREQADATDGDAGADVGEDGGGERYGAPE